MDIPRFIYPVNHRPCLGTPSDYIIIFKTILIQFDRFYVVKDPVYLKDCLLWGNFLVIMALLLEQ